MFCIRPYFFYCIRIAVMAVASICVQVMASDESNPLFSNAAAPADPFSTNNGGSVDFLPVDEAFQVTGERLSDQEVRVRFVIANGYYLYKGRSEFTKKDGEPVNQVRFLQPGIEKVDEYFGEVEVYYGVMEVAMPVTTTPWVLDVSYQGCAEAGLCYPPQNRRLSFSDQLGVVLPTVIDVNAPEFSSNAVSTDSDPKNSVATDATRNDLSQQLFTGSFLGSVALFFLAGIGLAFTPCVLPMVPILSSIIVGQGGHSSTRKAFNLSVVYVLGMSFTYTVLGVLVGLLGAEYNLTAKMQSPVVLSVLSGIFVVLALAMFGVYELRLPAVLSDRLNQLQSHQAGGQYLSVAVMGIISALVVSPCVSAPLIGALAYLSTTGDAVLGGSALFALSIGMGVPLIIVGVGQGRFIPKSGAWMNAVKAVFGTLLLAVAIWLLERILPQALVLALWAALLIGCAVYLGVLEPAKAHPASPLAKALGLFLLVYGVLLLIGAASGGHDPLRPLAMLSQTNAQSQVNSNNTVNKITITALDQLFQVQTQAVAQNKPMLVDVYADWCISCKVIERTVLADAQVQQALSQYTLVKADVTQSNQQSSQLLKHFGLFGPPSLLFFSGDGQELRPFRIQGDIDVPGFLQHLRAINENQQRLALNR